MPTPSAPYDALTIYFLSGTGNARRAAGWIARIARKRGAAATVVNLARFEERLIAAPPAGALIGLCYPTHGFNAAPLVLRFIHRLPRARNNDVFLLNTRAGMKLGAWFTPGLSGAALLLPALMLSRKGYRVAGLQPLDLPSNWISLHPALRGRAVTAIFARCRRICDRFTARLLAGRRVYRGLADLPVDLLLLPVALLYYVYGRFILAKTLIATEACDGCGACADACPVGAIRLVRGRPFWTFACESCMRCVNACPRRAIEAAHGYVALLWAVAFSLVPLALTDLLLSASGGFFPAEHRDFGWIATLLQWGLGIGVVCLGYRLLHRLMRFRWFDRLIVWTSLTHWRWWGRYRAPRGGRRG